jgi:hypothetical protein
VEGTLGIKWEARITGGPGKVKVDLPIASFGIEFSQNDLDPEMKAFIRDEKIRKSLLTPSDGSGVSDPRGGAGAGGAGGGPILIVPGLRLPDNEGAGGGGGGGEVSVGDITE